MVEAFDDDASNWSTLNYYDEGVSTQIFLAAVPFYAPTVDTTPPVFNLTWEGRPELPPGAGGSATITIDNPGTSTQGFGFNLTATYDT